MKPRALVTGATGLLGATLVREWLPRWSLTAVARKRRIAHPDVLTVNADVAGPEAADVIAHARPDVVVHTAAWTDLDACERDPAEARRIHVDASRTVARAAKRAGARLVYVSTDSMFSGPGRHREDSPTDAQSVYTRTKLEGEAVSLEECPETLIVRTTIAGWNAQPKTSLVEWMLRELRAGKTINGFHDVFFTPILCNDLASTVEALLERGVSGVINASGPECISKYDFAVKVAEVFGLRGDLVKRTSIESSTLFAPRPRHPCLDSSRCEALLGRTLPDILATLEAMRDLEQSGWVEEHRRFVD